VLLHRLMLLRQRRRLGLLNCLLHRLLPVKAAKQRPPGRLALALLWRIARRGSWLGWAAVSRQLLAGREAPVLQGCRAL
jgi:hypothetical protein